MDIKDIKYDEEYKCVKELEVPEERNEENKMKIEKGEIWKVWKTDGDYVRLYKGWTILDLTFKHFVECFDKIKLESEE